MPALVEVGIVAVDTPDDVFDPHPGGPELVTHRQEVVDPDRRVEHRAQDAPLPVLDALGDLDLALLGEE
ncbi:MAG TPA: hypothetical protein VMT03_25020 [Polyangia bacterium]|nr:hypothetical protein [Polyangia bacterium]